MTAVEIKALQNILYICYPVFFCQKSKVWAFKNFNSEINTITLVYAKQLGF